MAAVTGGIFWHWICGVGIADAVGVGEEGKAMKKLKLQKLMCCDCYRIFGEPRHGQGRQQETCDECHMKRLLQRQRTQEGKRKDARKALKNGN
tara:strand:+ start:2996 stop:3274 length:279 start_codon:yes stop_codon:yes gene_type:complete